MASGIQWRSGSVTGTGATLTVEGDLVGFRPRYVKVVNAATGASLEWFDSMPAAGGLLTVDHDTAQHSVITSAGISPTAQGFTIGADGSVNVSTNMLYYVAQG